MSQRCYETAARLANLTISSTLVIFFFRKTRQNQLLYMSTLPAARPIVSSNSVMLLLFITRLLLFVHCLWPYRDTGGRRPLIAEGRLPRKISGG